MAVNETQTEISVGFYSRKRLTEAKIDRLYQYVTSGLDQLHSRYPYSDDIYCEDQGDDAPDYYYILYTNFPQIVDRKFVYEIADVLDDAVTALGYRVDNICAEDYTADGEYIDGWDVR